MKTKMKSILLLITCILLMPIAVFAANIYPVSETFNLSANNSGLTGTYVTLNASLVSPTQATFLFTGLDDYKIGGVGLSLKPSMNTLSTWNSDTIMYDQPTDHNMDGFGTYNYYFKSSENSGNPSAVSNVTLTLNWDAKSFTSLSELFALNNKNSIAAVHLFTPYGADTGFAATTPIPAAAWLLGSGLLGLIGIRKRTNS